MITIRSNCHYFRTAMHSLFSQDAFLDEQKHIYIFDLRMSYNIAEMVSILKGVCPENSKVLLVHNDANIDKDTRFKIVRVNLDSDMSIWNRAVKLVISMPCNVIDTINFFFSVFHVNRFRGREKLILILVRKGMTTLEISSFLNMSSKLVLNYKAALAQHFNQPATVYLYTYLRRNLILDRV